MLQAHRLSVLTVLVSSWGGMPMEAQCAHLMRGRLDPMELPPLGIPFPVLEQPEGQAPFFWIGDDWETPATFRCLDLTGLEVGGKPLLLASTYDPTLPGRNYGHKYGLIISPKGRIRARVDSVTLRVSITPMRVAGKPERHGFVVRGLDWFDLLNPWDVPLYATCHITSKVWPRDYVLQIERVKSKDSSTPRGRQAL